MSLWTIAVIIVSAAVGVTPVLWLAKAGTGGGRRSPGRRGTLPASQPEDAGRGGGVRDEAKQLLDAAGALLTMRAGPKLVTRIGA